MVETVLMLPLLLLMLSGLLEFGFALNQYLNILDAAREGARYASDGDPNIRDSVTDCSSIDFYMKTACLVEQTAAPVTLDPATDDVVLSIFQVVTGTVWARLPDLPVDDPPGGVETAGEWHRYGMGGACSGNDCNPSRFCAADSDCAVPGTIDIRPLLDPAAPNTAVLVVEIFYGYKQILKLPWVTTFVPDPIELHTYTIVPLPAAEYKFPPP